MKDNYRIGSIFGIPLELHVSFLLLLLFFFIYSAVTLNPGPFIYIVLLFATVTLHELSHSLMAMRYGVKISKITLLPFGGIAAMEEIPKNPRKEFAIAIAGPGFNFAVGGITLAVILALGEGHRIFPFFEMKIESATDLLLLFFKINILLGAFNLFIPALPMDGGRVFRSLLAFKLGFSAATEIATGIAKMIAIFMALLGALLPNLWLIFIAFFVYIGATQEGEVSRIHLMLAGLKVRDLMSTEVVTVDEDITLQEFAEVIFTKKHMGYPVVSGGKLVGIITFSDLSRVPREKWATTRVGEVMTRKLLTISPEEEASEAFMRMARAGVGRLLVVSGGRLVGIISKTDLLRTLEIMRLMRE
ncbi:MAG: CBS domain-containing protein [Euryarchaeota archaeon]|nr:CBS domain-containing protein [Euryarchaeota archaeon]